MRVFRRLFSPEWGRRLAQFCVDRKRALSLGYLLAVGMALGAIWFYHDGRRDETKTAENALAFEEDHDIVEVIVAETTKPRVAMPELKHPSETIVAWRQNAVRVRDYVNDKPQISIVIDDLGVVRGRSLEIIHMEAPLTLSFLPYAPDLPKLTGMASARGHELMIHLPMEPKGDMDPGPHALLTGVPDQQNIRELLFNLSRFDGYVGLNNHMGSAFTENRPALDLVMKEVRKRGLLVLDSKTSGGSLLAEMATQADIPNVTRDFFLDNEQDVTYILAQLAKLEAMARRNGNAIAIGHPYRETIEALTLWLPTLQAKGIAIVPVSHLVKQKYQRQELADKSKTVFPAH